MKRLIWLSVGLLLGVSTVQAQQPVWLCEQINNALVPGTSCVPTGTSTNPSSVNVGSWAGVAAAAGSGVMTGGTPRIAIATDSPGLIATGTKGLPGVDIVTTQGAQGSATSRGGTITTGGTSQTIIASNATRAAFMVQNPCSAAEQGIGAAEDLVLNLTSAATLTTSANLVVLAPCASFSMGLNNGLVSTEAVTAIATTTGHVFYAKEF